MANSTDSEADFNDSFTFEVDGTDRDSGSNDANQVPDAASISKSVQLEQKINQVRSTIKEALDAAEADAAQQMAESGDRKRPKVSKRSLKKKNKKDADGEGGIDVGEDEEEEEDFFDADVPEGIKAESFAEMNLCRPLLKAINKLNYVTPTPIQKAAIPIAMMGKDICGGAVTGSGKTAAFLIPIIERLAHHRGGSGSKVLILLPTRELAVQCKDVCEGLSRHIPSIRVCLAAGGLPLRAQQGELARFPEIVIATPGRLIDHLHNTPTFTLNEIEILVLDEADRVLEDGFADELAEIIRHCPRERQTILFSATMTDSIDDLVRLSMKKPARLFVDRNTAIARKLAQEFIRIREGRESDRLPILLALCKRTCTQRCIIFTATKQSAHHLRIVLGLAGLRVGELHGGLTQPERLASLAAFKDASVDFLVCTDVASRGLDIQGVKFVINHSMPATYTLYLHRVGRTARAGLAGKSITLVGEGADRKLLRCALKNSLTPLLHRQLPTTIISKYAELLNGTILPQLSQILAEEEEARELEKGERDLERAENLIKYKEEIKSRPKKQWFQSEASRKASHKRDLPAPSA